MFFFYCTCAIQPAFSANNIQTNYLQKLKINDEEIHALAWYQNQQPNSDFLLACASQDSVSIASFNIGQRTFTKKLTKKIQANALTWYPTLPILTYAANNKINLLAYNAEKNKFSLCDTFEPNIGTINAITWHPTLRLDSCHVLACSALKNHTHNVYVYLYDFEKRSFTLLQKIQEYAAPTTSLVAWRKKILTLTYTDKLGFIQNSMYNAKKNAFEPVSTEQTSIRVLKKMDWHPTLPIIFGSQAYSSADSDAKNNGISLWAYDYSSNSFSYLHLIDLLSEEYLSEKHNLKYIDGSLDLCAPCSTIWHPKKSILTFGSKRGVISLWEVTGLEQSLNYDSGPRSAILDIATGQDVNIQATNTDAHK